MVNENVFALYILQNMSFLGVVKHAKRGPPNDPNRSPWRHGVGFLRFWSVLEKNEFLMMAKNGPQNQKDQKQTSAETTEVKRH